jgi:hypothetical protein
VHLELAEPSLAAVVAPRHDRVAGLDEQLTTTT